MLVPWAQLGATYIGVVNGVSRNDGDPPEFRSTRTAASDSVGLNDDYPFRVARLGRYRFERLKFGVHRFQNAAGGLVSSII